jgi:hypothetical protein
MLNAKRSEKRESKKSRNCNEIEVNIKTAPSICVRLPLTQLLIDSIKKSLFDLIILCTVSIKKSRPIRNSKFK